MLHKETVGDFTLDLLKTLMADEKLSDFFLVGWTCSCIANWGYPHIKSLPTMDNIRMASLVDIAAMKVAFPNE